jgi:hypothetical protein
MHALAAQFPLTGGRLRNAAVRAASHAASEGRSLTLSDLAGAASEELGERAPSRAVTAHVATGWEA